MELERKRHEYLVGADVRGLLESGDQYRVPAFEVRRLSLTGAEPAVNIAVGVRYRPWSPGEKGWFERLGAITLPVAMLTLLTERLREVYEGAQEASGDLDEALAREEVMV